MANDLTTARLIDIYESVLLDNQDELYLSHSESERNAFLDGAYVLFSAIDEAVRR